MGGEVYGDPGLTVPNYGCPMLDLQGVKGIKNTPYLGWSRLEWGGVGLARLHFWLQNAGFALPGKDGVPATH